MAEKRFKRYLNIIFHEEGVLKKRTYSEGNHPYNIVKAFTVPIPNGLRMVVVDASGLGNKQEDPWNVDLQSVETIKECVNHYRYTIQLDCRSWFYKIGTEKLKQYFGIRTIKGIYWLVVLAIGWSWSVWISHTIAREIADESERRGEFNKMSDIHVYVDNFIVVENTKFCSERKVEIIKEVDIECGAVFKEEENKPLESSDILGINYNLSEKTVSLKSSWAINFKKMVENYLYSPGKYHLQITWKFLGNIFWGMRVLASKLCKS